MCHWFAFQFFLCGELKLFWKAVVFVFLVCWQASGLLRFIRTAQVSTVWVMHSIRYLWKRPLSYHVVPDIQVRNLPRPSDPSTCPPFSVGLLSHYHSYLFIKCIQTPMTYSIRNEEFSWCKVLSFSSMHGWPVLVNAVSIQPQSAL